MGSEEEEEVKLYGTWASPYSRRIELALRLKNIKFEYVEEVLANKSQDLLHYNPVYKQVPVLVHNGKSISESLIIMEYIDETWKDRYRLLPEDAYDRAMARFWAKFIDDKLPIVTMPTKIVLAKGKEQEEIIKKLREALVLLEKEIEGKEYYGGNEIEYLDIAAFIVVYWFRVRQESMGIELMNEEMFPWLYKWMERLRSLDVVNECVPQDHNKHVAYIKAKLDAAKAKAATAAAAAAASASN